jgi:hypothetical protein
MMPLSTISFLRGEYLYVKFSELKYVQKILVKGKANKSDAFLLNGTRYLIS